MLRPREDISKIHVVFLHNRLKKRYQDKYLIDIATGIQKTGHKVTIYTSEFDQYNAFEEVNILTGMLEVKYSSWWLPKEFKFLKSMFMALNLVFFQPYPKPDLVILDVNPVALFIISMLTNIKTVYLAHFNVMQKAEVLSKFIKVTPDFLSEHCLNYADDIVVQSEGLGRIFKRSFPFYKNKIHVIYPTMETGMWKEKSLDISRLLPIVPTPIFLFVCFGNYKKRSNFKLVLEAFENLILTADARIKNHLHLVLAGHYNENCSMEAAYFNEIMGYIKDKSFASQVTFLEELPTIYKKTLIEKSIAVIVPCKYDVFPDIILAALAAGKPIIATNTGFAREALKHRMTGILVKPSPINFASEMDNILSYPCFYNFLSNMAEEVFRKKYSYSVFTAKINEIVNKYARLE